MRSRPAPASRAKSEGVLEELLVDAGREIPEALAGGRRDEGGDIEPLEPVVARGDGALAARRPDPTQDRLQPYAMLVGGEGLDYRAGMALRLLGDGLGELFLNGQLTQIAALHAPVGRRARAAPKGTASMSSWLPCAHPSKRWGLRENPARFKAVERTAYVPDCTGWIFGAVSVFRVDLRPNLWNI
jgi:hypothetical protein